MVTGQMINSQKSVTFVCTSNNQLKYVMAKDPFTVTYQKRNEIAALALPGRVDTGGDEDSQ